MSYREVFREACESMGEGYFELVRGLLAPHLGEDPFAKVLDDPSEFLRYLRIALGSEADRLLASLAVTLRQRGADVNLRQLERILEIGDRARVRALFSKVSNATPLEANYRELILRQLDGLSARRRKRVILSSLLLALAVFSLIYLMTLMLSDYIAREALNGILVVGLIVSAALALENYMINVTGAPKAQVSVRVRVMDASALGKARIPELAGAIRDLVDSEIDLIELSKATSIPLPDLISEMVRLQREGAVKLEFL